MSEPRYPRDPFDQSQYRPERDRRYEERPADPYGQEAWMLDPEGGEEPFDWGGAVDGGSYQQPHQGYPPASRAAQPPAGPPPAGPPPSAPPPAYQPEQGYQQGWQDEAYPTGAYPADAAQPGAHQTGGYQTGDYQTGTWETGGYDAGAYQGDYQTGTWETGAYEGTQHPEAYQTGQYDAYPTGDYQSGDYQTGGYQVEGYDDEYLTGAYDSAQFNQYAADQEARQAEPEAWPTAAEMHGRTDDPEPTGEVPVQQAILRRVRRQRGRGFDATVLAAVVLVVVTGIALVATRPHPFDQPDLAAHTSKPRSATAMCPGKPKGVADTLDIGDAAASGSGPVELTGSGVGQKGSATVSSGKLTQKSASAGSVVVKAGADTASGLVAGRSTSKPLAAVDCGPPQATAWFSGVGAGAAHNSVLELTNPNSGSATVDVALFDEKGPIAVPDEMRGIAIPGNSTRTFDLLHQVPREGELALSTTVVRGQVGAMVRDRAVDVVSGAGTDDWLPGQSEPSQVNRLVGLPKNPDDAQLTVANPGDDQIHVSLKLMTPHSILTPQGAPDLDVAPHGVASADLSKVLANAGDAYGLEVTGSAPVTAALRTVDSGDVALTTPAEAVSGQTAAVLPTDHVMTKKIEIASESGSGSVEVTALSANGRKLRSRTAKVGDQGGVEITVPANAALVQLVPHGVKVHAAAVMSGNGDTVVPFRQLRTVARNASVAPGLPMPLRMSKSDKPTPEDE